MGPTRRRALRNICGATLACVARAPQRLRRRSSSTIRLVERIICGKHTARTRATQYTQQEPFVAITPKILQRSHLLREEGDCRIHTNIVVTQRGVCPRKPVASKQPTCVESKRKVNKVNGVLTETVRCQHSHRPTTHTPSHTALLPP